MAEEKSVKIYAAVRVPVGHENNPDVLALAKAAAALFGLDEVPVEAVEFRECDERPAWAEGFDSDVAYSHHGRSIDVLPLAKL